MGLWNNQPNSSFFNDNAWKLRENQRKTHKSINESRQDWELHLDLKNEIKKDKYEKEKETVKLERKKKDEVEAP